MGPDGRIGGPRPPTGRRGAPEGQYGHVVGPPQGMALRRPDRAGADLRRGARLSLGQGTQDRAAPVRLRRPLERQDPHLQRRMGAVAGAAGAVGSPYSTIQDCPLLNTFFFPAKPFYARHRRSDRDGANSHPGARGDQPRALFFFCSPLI
ncbi:conserved hypothetical protein [Sphingomonas aurantiaca]|uniref:Uncharacterized protein n=1 Tax=Sphingomonas aurantiaca TaxID=185949 RepID=A0A5E7XWM1_9SPHN|nr:conserved hypothetical protein [Sphingomonas aurantiaca]